MAGSIVVASAYVLGQLMHDPALPFGFALFFFAVAFACGAAAPTALMLLVRGGKEIPAQAEAEIGRPPAPTAGTRVSGRSERQLLEAIERRGEITPTRAALETSLTVEEADRTLSDLAKQGHLDVRVKDGKLVYTF